MTWSRRSSWVSDAYEPRERLLPIHAFDHPRGLADALGDDGAHYLNGTILTILVLLIAFQRRVVHSRWRATAGVALVVLFPTYVHLWALTLTRDLSTHLAGLLGLFLLLPTAPLSRSVAASGLALGFAATIRPDAILYLVPAGCSPSRAGTGNASRIRAPRTRGGGARRDARRPFPRLLLGTGTPSPDAGDGDGAVPDDGPAHPSSPPAHGHMGSRRVPGVGDPPLRSRAAGFASSISG